jgi:acyl dehydratase
MVQRISTPLTSKSLKVGDEAPALTHALTRTDLVQYAGASGDFNPMHTDEVAAKEAGLNSVFGHGMFSAGLLATAITNWAGVGNIRRLNVRFVKQAWPGEEFTTTVVVKAKRTDGEVHLIDLDCSLSNQSGEVKVAGEATIAVGSDV